MNIKKSTESNGNLASQYTVLVVDDVPTNVMLVQAILKKEGYTLLTTDSGAKALRIAQERHPNLILLDIMMPEMDGYEVLQHLKSNPETKQTSPSLSCQL